MSTVELTSRWLERSSDWMNPILVKEVRQSLKSRQFVATFMLLLVAAWLITVFGLLLAGQQVEYGSAGRGFFYLYYLVLCVAAHVIVPFGAFRALLNERDHNTYELLSITDLKPRQIVWGKLLSAAVQVFIFYSAIAPFIAFTSLLEGFDLPLVVFLLTLTLLISLALSMVALMFSTLSKQKAWQGLIAMQTLGGLVAGFFAWLSFVSAELFFDPINFDDAEFWWIMGSLLVASLSYFILCQQVTTAQLTFEADNRSTAIRATCSIQFWLFLVGWCVVKWFNQTTFEFDPEELMVLCTLACVHWAAVGLFVATESDTLSRRVRRDLPQNGLLRLLLTPFEPGGARGLFYLLVHLIALLAFVVAMCALGLVSVRRSLSAVEVIAYAVAVVSYVLIFVGFGTAVGRWGRSISAEVRPAHARVTVLILFAFGVIAPYIPAALDLVRWNRYSALYLTSPFETLAQLVDGDEGWVAPILAAAAILVIALNARAMMRGVTEIARSAGIEPRPETVPAEPSTNGQPYAEQSLQPTTMQADGY